MLTCNRIFRFVTVAFILLFSGRISKAELFHSYFRQIQDIEIRNSQDLIQSKAAIITQGLIIREGNSVFQAPAAIVEFFQFPFLNLKTRVLQAFSAFLPFVAQRFDFFLSSPPMAP